MFGGFAYYCENRLVLVTFESTGNRSYKNVKYDFEIWNGCMFPVDKEFHSEIKTQFPFLINHPVLPKWLYIPLDSEDFESQVEVVMKQIKRRNLQFGTTPKQKKSKSRKVNERIDTRRPQMFRDEPAEDRLKKAQRISDLKNLGPTTEKHFAKAGIKGVSHFVKLGWKKTMLLLIKSNPKTAHPLYAYALIGALKNLDWNQIPESDKQASKDFIRDLKSKNKKKRSKKMIYQPSN